ncbi:DUF7024 domain-containing protein [Massilia aurea]|uniref:DUF7024 domain-containing protein n=1 Tax=Massilia aurea TaxID=373040 RepID=UPI00161DF1F7|nr:hypothetical protein [Massilia aurea]
MNFSTFDRHRKAWSVLFGLALAAMTAYLAMRNHGLNPTVFADEWYYSKMARLLPLSEALVPSYLYLWLFGASDACGAGFLDCVRAANLAFYLAAAPFLYLIARRYIGPAWAAVVAVLSLGAPLNIYTAYFMPEATYYFGFCVLSWIMLARADWSLLARALAGGLVLGTMSLVKVHALFLLPALCVFVLYAGWHAGGAWLARGLLAAAVAAAGTLAVKFGLGYVLAGDAGLSVFGPFYQGAVRSEGASARLALLAPAFVNGRGHLMALAMLLGLPLAVILHGLCAGLGRRDAGNEGARALHVYAILMLASAAGVTVLYTATLAHPGSNEGFRLHLRYYDFVFPLVWIAGAATLQDARARLPRLRWIIAALVAALLVLAWFKLPEYSVFTVDGPDVSLVTLPAPYGRLALGFLLALQLALLALWAVPRAGAARLTPGRVFLFTALPLSMLAAQFQIWTWTQAHRPDGHGDRAAKAVLQHVPPAERGKVMIVGNEMTQVMRVQFHLDHPDTVGVEMRDNAPLLEYQLPVDQKWLLVMDKRDIPGSPHVVHQADDFTLLRMPEPPPAFAHVKLSEQPDPGFISAIEGLSGPEAWGRWSEAKQVVFHFAKPLPRSFGLVFEGRAHADNASLPFTIEIGGVRKEFRLGWHPAPVNLQFDTDGTARSMTIVVPKPMPASTTPSGDPRLIGIGIGWLTFTIPQGSPPVAAGQQP